MKIRLVRAYQTKAAGDILSTVPTAKAMQLIKNGIAVIVEDKRPKNVSKARTIEE